MIIAVDDSGDPGFKLGKGSSEYFVIAAIFFDDDLDAEEAALKIKRLRKSLHWNPSHEFKFRKSSAEIKRLFFEVIAPLNFRAAISIVDKRHFADKTLQRETSKFYNTIILRTLLTSGQFNRAHIYIDGEGGNDYRRKVKTFFRQNLPRNAIRVLTYRDSNAATPTVGISLPTTMLIFSLATTILFKPPRLVRLRLMEKLQILFAPLAGYFLHTMSGSFYLERMALVVDQITVE